MRVVGYSLLALNGLLSVCVFMGVKVPWVFATPSIFASVTLVLLLVPIFLLDATGESYSKIKLTLFCYFLGVMLIFPLVFNFSYEASSQLLSWGLYRIIVLLLAVFTLQLGSRVVTGTEIPLVFLLVIFPALIVLMHWLYEPDTPLSELKVLCTVVFVGGLVGLLYGWLRQG